MGIRRRAREVALQLCYMCDSLRSSESTDMSFALDYFQVAKGIRPYALELCQGVAANLTEIDSKISAASEHWSVSRMNRIDRALLRLATFEMVFCKEVPHSVCINEAIEISKRFCDRESPMFINGILDRIAGTVRSKVEVVVTPPAVTEVATEEHVVPEIVAADLRKTG